MLNQSRRILFEGVARHTSVDRKNLGFALRKCERVTIATFMCVYTVAAALAVLGDRFSYAAIARGNTNVGVATSFPCQSRFFSPPFRKGSRLDCDEPRDLSVKILKTQPLSLSCLHVCCNWCCVVSLRNPGLEGQGCLILCDKYCVFY